MAAYTVYFQLVADEKWGDCRRHLAMIMSNSTNKPDVDRKSIVTLGDTLGMSDTLGMFQTTVEPHPQNTSKL